MKRPIGLVVTVALAVSLTAPAALANVITPTYSGLWGQNQEVPFRWKEDGVPPGWMKNAISGAAGDSARSRNAKAPTFVLRDGSESWVTYSAELPTTTSLAFAHRNAPNWFRIWLRTQGHVFDWGTLRWCQFYDNPPNGCFDAQTAALHEFGHVHALQHSSVQPPHTLMQPLSLSKPKEYYNMRGYGPCDVAALQTRYEAQTASTPISTCLSLATDLALSASTTTVSTTSGVTFTASLAIADDVVHAKLAGDPLSGRQVFLQRRSPGGSTWTTQAQMAGTTTAGTYRLTVTPGATYDWRAVFSQPSTEGLDGAASAVIRVTLEVRCGMHPCPL
jgi:hypothetical protein